MAPSCGVLQQLSSAALGAVVRVSQIVVSFVPVRSAHRSSEFEAWQTIVSDDADPAAVACMQTAASPRIPSQRVADTVAFTSSVSPALNTDP